MKCNGSFIGFGIEFAWIHGLTFVGPNHIQCGPIFVHTCGNCSMWQHAAVNTCHPFGMPGIKKGNPGNKT